MNEQRETALEAVEESPDVAETELPSQEATLDVDALKMESRQEGKTAERERIAAILAAPEAEGRADLARSLALETDLDVTSALRVLSSAPEQAMGGAALSAAMANVRNPIGGR